MLNEETRARIAVASGRAGGLRNVARNGGRATAAPARAGFIRRFEREVDPDNLLSPEERVRRAGAAMKAHMATLSLRSARKRAGLKPKTKTEPQTAPPCDDRPYVYLHYVDGKVVYAGRGVRNRAWEPRLWKPDRITRHFCEDFAHSLVLEAMFIRKHRPVHNRLGINR